MICNIDWCKPQFHDYHEIVAAPLGSQGWYTRASVPGVRGLWSEGYSRLARKKVAGKGRCGRRQAFYLYVEGNSDEVRDMASAGAVIWCNSVLDGYVVSLVSFHHSA